MRRSESLLHVAAALLIFALVGNAAAQYDIRPFDEHPVAISAAFGAEMAVLRLEASKALFEEGVGHDEVAELLAGLQLEWLRFAAALRDANPTLFGEALQAFEAIDEDDSAAAVAQALPLARHVRDVVSGPLVSEPADAAAILALLLVAETGIAEGWEEAAEGEVGPYAVGWAGIPRAYELWELLRPHATENQIFEIEDQLGELGLLFENPTPPNMAGADPEEGEGAAVHVAGFLEDVSNAWLFPDRDLGGLLRNTQEVAAAGCSAYDNGKALTGDAHIAWVGFAYGEYLAGTLSLLAPEAFAELDELLAGVTGADEDEQREDALPDEENAAEFGDEDDVRFSPESCPALLEALGKAGGPLGL